jgi:hypothetical protein
MAAGTLSGGPWGPKSKGRKDSEWPVVSSQILDVRSQCFAERPQRPATRDRNSKSQAT